MTIAEIAENVTRLLGSEADELGTSSGFIQRRRKLSGSSFAQMLVGGALGTPELSYTDMVQYAALADVKISAQGVAQRFTATGARFMAALLERAVNYVVASELSVVVPVLTQFTGVYIRDSSVIGLPRSLVEHWPGVGNAAGESAAVKLQVRLNYNTGALDGPVLQAGRMADRSTPYCSDDEPRGSLSLADLGYFNLEELRERDQRGQYVIVRYKQGTVLYTAGGTRLDLLAWLQQLNEPRAELQVCVGQRQRLPMRLLVERVPSEVAEQRRRRLREYARKKQTTPRAETLALTEWTMVLTNAPGTMLTFEAVQVLLYVRWQVELLFKLWKSQLRVDEWRSDNPWRILCELYGKLIAAVLSQWVFQLELWRYPDRSLVKATLALQKFAGSLVQALRHPEALAATLQWISDCICHTAHTNKRRQRPATFQALLACPVGGGLT